MKRQGARPERARTVAVQREGDAPVLPKDAGFRQHDARAEIEIDALNVADGAALAVDRREPNRIAAGRLRLPGPRAAGIDAAGKPVEISRIEQARGIGMHLRRVADVAIADR